MNPKPTWISPLYSGMVVLGSRKDTKSLSHGGNMFSANSLRERVKAANKKSADKVIDLIKFEMTKAADRGERSYTVDHGAYYQLSIEEKIQVDVYFSKAGFKLLNMGLNYRAYKW